MAIYGTALISVCLIGGLVVGLIVGKLIGLAIGIDANVGGVGIAMLLLILISGRVQSAGLMAKPTQNGVLFWSSIYIPIVVAMIASQNVRAAVCGGTVTGTALGASSDVIALSVAAGLVKSMLVMIATPVAAKWIGLDNPRSALIFGGLMGTTSGVAGGLAATDEKLVPYGAMTATFYTGLGCLLGPSCRVRCGRERRSKPFHDSTSTRFSTVLPIEPTPYSWRFRRST